MLISIEAVYNINAKIKYSNNLYDVNIVSEHVNINKYKYKFNSQIILCRFEFNCVIIIIKIWLSNVSVYQQVPHRGYIPVIEYID